MSTTGSLNEILFVFCIKSTYNICAFFMKLFVEYGNLLRPKSTEPELDQSCGNKAFQVSFLYDYFTCIKLTVKPSLVTFIERFISKTIEVKNISIV